MARTRKARETDIDAIARAMPHTSLTKSASGHPYYQVGGRTFVFYRGPRPDAVDPDTGERYADVTGFRTATEEEKILRVNDDSPFFTTPHFDGYNAILLRRSGSVSSRMTSWLR